MSDNRRAVRIPEATYTAIRELSDGRPLGEVVADAVEMYRRHDILDRANRAWAELKRDPVAWAAELAERSELGA